MCNLSWIHRAVCKTVLSIQYMIRHKLCLPRYMTSPAQPCAWPTARADSQQVSHAHRQYTAAAAPGDREVIYTEQVIK